MEITVKDNYNSSLSSFKPEKLSKIDNKIYWVANVGKQLI